MYDFFPLFDGDKFVAARWIEYPFAFVCIQKQGYMIAPFVLFAFVRYPNSFFGTSWFPSFWKCPYFLAVYALLIGQSPHCMGSNRATIIHMEFFDWKAFMNGEEPKQSVGSFQ